MVSAWTSAHLVSPYVTECMLWPDFDGHLFDVTAWNTCILILTYQISHHLIPGQSQSQRTSYRLHIGEDKVLTVHVMKAYGGLKVQLGARWGERSPSFSGRFICGGRSPVGGSESLSGRFEENNLLPHQRIKPGFLDGLAQIGKCKHIQFLLCFELTSRPSSPPPPHHAYASTIHLSSEQPKLVKRYDT